MAGALFTGCGGGDKPADKPAASTVKLGGMITHLNATENQLGETYNKFADNAGLKGARYSPKFYDSLRAMQMGIESGEVSEVSLYKSVADYVIANNDKIPTLDGAPSLKVGITGDLPPLDLILSDNSPAGFNTAMLAEIAKRLGRNVEPVQIESGARATALTSKFIDVVFWAVVPLGKDLPADLDKPEGVELSTPYFKDGVAHVKLKGDK